MTMEDDNLDLAELARDNPTPDVWPLGHAARFPRGSHIFIEVRNNLPSGDVACMIDYSLSGDSKIEKRGASVAVCEVYLQ